MAYDAVSLSRPAGKAQPGTKALLDHVLATFGGTNLGIYNPRDVCGNVWPNIKCATSFHFEGRAGDAGVPVERPQGSPVGHTIAEWLVANHEALGVQEVIWAGRRWDARIGRWARYTGRSDHFDHVHFAQTWNGAQNLTSQQIAAVGGGSSTQHQEDDLTPEQDALLRDIFDRVTGMHQGTEGADGKYLGWVDKRGRGDLRWVAQGFGPVLAAALANLAPGGTVDVDALAAQLKDSLGDELVKALAEALTD